MKEYVAILLCVLGLATGVVGFACNNYVLTHRLENQAREIAQLKKERDNYQRALYKMAERKP
jgi:hypothetical protein